MTSDNPQTPPPVKGGIADLFSALHSLGMLPTPTPTPPLPRENRVAPLDAADSPYGLTAITGMADQMASAAIGGRDDLLNTLCMKAGGLIRDGRITRTTAESYLRDAALTVSDASFTSAQIDEKLSRVIDEGIASTYEVTPRETAPQAFGGELAAAVKCCDDGPAGHTRQEHHDASACYDLACRMKHPHGGPYSAEPDGAPAEAGETPEPAETPTEAVSRIVRAKLPLLDWHALWADDSDEEWIVEPILPARRLIALYSPPKVGKSLLLLELCCAIATGRDVLGVSIDRPRRVLYVDFENDPKADIRERLQAMGYGPDDLGNLCYLSFPSIASLDSVAGGLELMAAVAEYQCEVVVIDTVSRAVAGEENENDTWLAFYRHTGLLLKQAGVALIRLDHSGKDETKGQRGGSAKSGDVDAVWRLSRINDDTYRLDCEAARMPIAEKTLVLHREQGPLRHRVDAEGRSAAWRIKVDALVKAMDALGLPDETGSTVARRELRAAGHKVSNVVLPDALKKRQDRSEIASDRWSQDTGPN